MKLHAIAAVWSVVLCFSNLHADCPEFTICTAGNVQKNPDISGDIVAWEDYRNGTIDQDIYWLRLSDPNRVQNRIALPGNQFNPAVSGNTIVLQDDRDKTNRETCVYDIMTGAIISLPDGANQKNPDVSAQVIVCESFVNGFYNAAVWDSDTNSYDLIDPYAEAQIQIAVDSTFVVWSDYRGEIPQVYGCDVSAEPRAAFLLCPATDGQARPAISGSIVVWEEAAAETTTLTAFNWQTGTVIWTYVLPPAEANPSISNGVVVWQEFDPIENGYDIVGYDLNTGTFIEIAAGLPNDQYPVISGSTVVWQRDGVDIMGAVIPSAPDPGVIAVLAPNGGEMFLSGNMVPVTWTMVRGDAPEAVNVDCSFDNGSTWTPAASHVPFAEPYQWAPSGDVDSPDCLVRVSASNNAQVADVSDTPFTIFQCSSALTADLTGDCFVDLQDVAVLAAQWLASGNPYDVNFYERTL